MRMSLPTMTSCRVPNCRCTACCALQYGMLSVVFLMALAFALVSPMVLPLASLFFMFSWLFWRYSLLYV